MSRKISTNSQEGIIYINAEFSRFERNLMINLQIERTGEKSRGYDYKKHEETL